MHNGTEAKPARKSVLGAALALSFWRGVWWVLEKVAVANEVSNAASSVWPFLKAHGISLLGLCLVVYEFGRSRGLWLRLRSRMFSTEQKTTVDDQERHLAAENQQLGERIAALEAFRDAPKPIPEPMARPDSVDCFLAIYGHWRDALTEISSFLFNHVYRAPDDASEEIKLINEKTCQELGNRATEFQNLSDMVSGLRGPVSQDRFDMS